MRPPTVNLSADFGPIREYLDITEALALVEASGRTQSKRTLAMGISAASNFNMHADLQAQSNPEQLHHVYDWGEAGQASGRLWAVVLAGRGNSRLLNYIFTPSQNFVPQGEQHTGISGDLRGRAPENRRHIFRWKAPIMEEGRTVEVGTRTAKNLAIPVGSVMIFRKGPIKVTPGKGVAGNFDNLWNTFFMVHAQVLIEEEFVKPAGRFYETEVPAKLYNKISKSRPGVGINTTPRRRHKDRATALVDNYLDEQVSKAKRKARATGTPL